MYKKYRNINNIDKICKDNVSVLFNIDINTETEVEDDTDSTEKCTHSLMNPDYDKSGFINDTELSEIEKNMECLINGAMQNNLYIDYETSILIQYAKKYPSIIEKFSEKIYNKYVNYFANLCESINKYLYIDFEYNLDSLIKYFIENIISEEDIYFLFEILFRNKNNTISTINIKYFTYSITGHNIIKCYINNGGTFNHSETEIFMKCIGIVPIYKIAESLISIINENDVFSYNEKLLEYATYIPLNDYSKRCFLKNHYINEKIAHNIIAYSNDIDLCHFLSEKNISFDKYYLKQSLKSRNKNIIKFILNNKIIPDQTTFDFIIRLILYDSSQNDTYRFKFFSMDQTDVFLYAEIDKYNNDNDIPPPLLLRKTYLKDYLLCSEMMYLIGEYGYSYAFDNFLIAFKYNILLHEAEVDFDNKNNKDLFLDSCSDISYYPYFENKKYPKPNYNCLAKECQRKGNIKIIKQIYECIDEHIDKYDINLLRSACLINNNTSTIKFFVEKKNITPDFICIENSIKSINKDRVKEIMDKYGYNENKDININQIGEMTISYGNNTTKYLHKKYSLNKT